MIGSDFVAALGTAVLTIADFIHVLFEKIPFSTATWFVIGIMAFSTWIFARASKNPKSRINWEDMIVDSATDRTSPYKLGYLIGVIISTWVVITLLDGQKLGLDILGAYLTYLVGGAGFTEWLKHGKEPDSVTEAKQTDRKAKQIDRADEA